MRFEKLDAGEIHALEAQLIEGYVRFAGKRNWADIKAAASEGETKALEVVARAADFFAERGAGKSGLGHASSELRYSPRTSAEHRELSTSATYRIRCRGSAATRSSGRLRQASS